MSIKQQQVVVQVKGEKLDYNIEGGEGVLEDNYDTDIGENEEGYISGNYFYESVIVYYEEAIDENPSEEVGIRVEQGDKDYDDKEDEEEIRKKNRKLNRKIKDNQNKINSKKQKRKKRKPKILMSRKRRRK
ncbi:MAG: hypothetical protein EZS28_026777 [Streblomastix strix]|uniref:Uncharacterized protein n=1 Tax=Streblomastix strix TaxID=222440 RepID=A0A5J4V4M2_9EUKA|nr:MAG: hypothetical protein EZS28_026777 [Streblomastix strix]